MNKRKCRWRCCWSDRKICTTDPCNRNHSNNNRIRTWMPKSRLSSQTCSPQKGIPSNFVIRDSMKYMCAIVYRWLCSRFRVVNKHREEDEGFLSGVSIPTPWSSGRTLESVHPVRDNYKYKETVQIPSARCLYLRFDPRCSSQYDYDKASKTSLNLFVFKWRNHLISPILFCCSFKCLLVIRQMPRKWRSSEEIHTASEVGVCSAQAGLKTH